MEAAMSELPLALFTVFASIGAGAFCALALAGFSVQLDEGQQARVDRASWIPLAFVIIGFFCAFFHLSNALNAVNVVAGLGRSPLTNEICAGSLFTIVAIIYVALANAGKLSAGARKGLLGVTGVLGLVFGLFMGLAYMIGTVQSWNSWATIAEMVGLTLVGGAAMGSFVLASAEGASKASGALTAMGYVGAIAAIAGGACMAAMVSGEGTALYAGSNLVAAAMPALVIGCVCVIAAAVAAGAAWKRGASVGAVAIVLVVIGALALRLAFYAMQLSVGLSIM